MHVWEEGCRNAHVCIQEIQLSGKCMSAGVQDTGKHSHMGPSPLDRFPSLPRNPSGKSWKMGAKLPCPHPTFSLPSPPTLGLTQKLDPKVAGFSE